MERLVCVGVMFKTSDRTFTVGRKRVAPKGDIRAATETKEMIHNRAPRPQIVYGGPEICLSRPSGTLFFSTSTTFEDSTGPTASLREVSEPCSVVPIDEAVSMRYGYQGVV